MDPKIIDGKTLAKKHEDILKAELSGLNGRRPTLVSFCNRDDLLSVKYTFLKKQKALDLGIKFLVEEMNSQTSKDDLAGRLKKYGEDWNIDGILIQLPLSDLLKPYKDDLVNLIPLEKDSDGLTGKGKFLPATVKGVISILDEEISGWTEKKIAIVGSKGEVGKHLSLALHTRSGKLIEVDKNIGDLGKDLQDADIVTSATGKKSLIKPEMIKDGAILIDIGLGDFDPGSYHKASKYTPVIGGVGPMTVISLMENVVESYRKRMVE